MKEKINYEESLIFSQKLVNVGSQTTELTLLIFTHPVQFSHGVQGMHGRIDVSRGRDEPQR